MGATRMARGHGTTKPTCGNQNGYLAKSHEKYHQKTPPGSGQEIPRDIRNSARSHNFSKNWLEEHQKATHQYTKRNKIYPEHQHKIHETIKQGIQINCHVNTKPSPAESTTSHERHYWGDATEKLQVAEKTENVLHYKNK